VSLLFYCHFQFTEISFIRLSSYRAKTVFCAVYTVLRLNQCLGLMLGRGQVTVAWMDG
jgi:hypothetical protein